MSAMEALQSVQFVEAKGKRFAVISEEEWEALIEWLETLEDLVEAFGDRPELLRKLILLRDCTSPVLHPQIDFRAIAEARLAEFKRMGVQIAVSTFDWTTL